MKFGVFFFVLSMVPLHAQDSMEERLQVTRMLVDVRVLDKRGDAITDLRKDEFELKSRGQNLEIISASWVDDAAPVGRERGGEIIDLGTTESDDDDFWQPIKPGAKTALNGRVYVFFLQKDVSNSVTRYLQRMVSYIKEVAREMSPSDYVAVFSYEYKLKLHLDLTRAKPLMEEALAEAIIGADGIEFGDGTDRDNLAGLIDRYKVEKAVNVEKALLLVGEALGEFDGAKSLVFMGYGMGNWLNGRKVKKPAFDPAVEALQEAHTAVYVMDVLREDISSRPSMLRQLAQDTGGYYRQARRSPSRVLSQLISATGGHYQLVFKIPEDQKNPRYRLKVTRKHQELLVRKPINEQDYTF